MSTKIQNYSEEPENKFKEKEAFQAELQQIRKRIVEMEEKASSSIEKEMEDLKENNKEIDKKGKASEDSLVTCEKIEVDIYFYMPVIYRLFFKFLFLFLYYLLTLPYHLCKENKEERLTNFALSFLGTLTYLFISIKSVVTFLVQIYLTTELLQNITTEFNDKFQTSKIFISLILASIVYKEVIQGFRNALYSVQIIWKTFNLEKHKSCWEHFLANVLSLFLIFPGLGQICVSIWIYYSSMIVIKGTDSILDLIQNFAGLVVILEIDNYAWDVMVILRGHTFAIIALERFFYKIEDKSQEIIEYLSNMINEEGVLLRPKRDFSQCVAGFYYVVKILLIIAFVIFSIVFIEKA